MKSKAISASIILSMLLSIVPITNVSAELDASTLPTHLMNGSFESPTLPERSSWSWGKDDDSSSWTGGVWYITSDSKFETMAAENNEEPFYWKSTASTGFVELVEGTGRRGSIADYNVSAPYHGNQFAELVAEEQASLYQNISTPIPGYVNEWSISHAGRDTKDTMAVFVGPAHENYKVAEASHKDLFMWMAEYIKTTSSLNWETASVGSSQHTIYTIPNLDLSQVTDENFTQFFSLAYTSATSERWVCWLITDEAGTWAEYTGQYTVPDNQPITTIAFTALTGQSVNAQVEGQINEGNLVDGMSFGTTYPIRIATTAGGYGVLDYHDTTITSDADYVDSFADGTTLNITAYPKEGYYFLGTLAEGRFYPLTAPSYVEVEPGVYSHPIQMTAPRYIQLIFAKAETVVYDPNGGMYKGATENTEIKMKAYPDETLGECSQWINTESAVPIPGYEYKIRFIGWYAARIEYEGTTGALITSDHQIDYTLAGDSPDINQDTLDLTYSLAFRDSNDLKKFSVSGGLVLIAQWESKQDVQIKTKKIDDPSYADDTSGGMVEQTITAFNNKTPRNEGWGHLRDRVTLRATANPGYRFRGWYDENKKLLSSYTTYEYEVVGDTLVYACFSEIHNPLVSFVSATGEEQLNGNGTHILSTWNGGLFGGMDDNIGGEDIYGNTIATAFYTHQQFDGSTPYNFTQWSITIPTPSLTAPLYIKNNGLPENDTMIFNSAPIVSDGTNVQANKGEIYEVTGLNANAEFITLNLFNPLPTKVTCEGTTDIAYILSIDNIYAPGATATVDLRETMEQMLFDSVYISNDETHYMHSSSLDAFLTDPNNKYAGVDTEVGGAE